MIFFVSMQKAAPEMECKKPTGIPPKKEQMSSHKERGKRRTHARTHAHAILVLHTPDLRTFFLFPFPGIIHLALISLTD